jgi:hypothetical protein
MVQYISEGWVDEITGDYHKGGCWYFWDEAGMHVYGPYETREDAEEAAQAYAQMVLGL